mmetsp:Transcript_92100/g.214063  ORF Transcript_92100/g.214063 Transcript_92100/m.214063 type:complete len:223 (-) Transcript_92100:171-839(-)
MHLNVVHHGSNRHVVEWHRVAHKDRSIRSGDDLLPHEEAKRVQDVALLTIFIAHQADAGVAVRIVLDGFYGAKHAALGSAKVDDTVDPGVATSVHVPVTRLAGGPCGHLDWFVLGARKAAAEHEAEWLIAHLRGQLLEGRNAAVPQCVVFWLADAHTGRCLGFTLCTPHHPRPLEKRGGHTDNGRKEGKLRRPLSSQRCLERHFSGWRDLPSCELLGPLHRT